MLRHYSLPHELEEAEQLSSSSVYLLSIHYSIRHERLGIFPEAKCTVLAYPSHQPNLWMIIRRNKFTKPHVFVASQSQCRIPINEIDTFFILTLPYLLELDQFFARILGTNLSSRMSELLSSHFDFTSASHLSSYFVMVDEMKQRQIIEMDIQLGGGYSLADLDPDIDADIVSSCWKFSTPGDRDQFAAKIRRLPSVGIRSADGSLASFTVLDASGFFNNQYTFVEHRQKGLANLCELRLAQKVISFGLNPLKFVEHDNVAVLSRSLTSPWWTTVTDESGLPVINDHRLIHRRV